MYSARVVLIIPDKSLEQFSNVFGILDPDSGGRDTFSIPLSATGKGRPTHWGAFTALEQDTKEALQTYSKKRFETFVRGKASRRRQILPKENVEKTDLIVAEVPRDGFEAYLKTIGLKVIMSSSSRKPA